METELKQQIKNKQITGVSSFGASFLHFLAPNDEVMIKNYRNIEKKVLTFKAL